MGRLEGIDFAAAGRQPALMGVVNVTPDSFYDGGRFADASSSTRRVDELCAEGAHIIDVGGESSRPGSAAVPAQEQIRRIDAALRHALAAGVKVSVDTTSPQVARHALELGAHIVNDVSCLADPQLAVVAAEHDAILIVMHSRGSMSAMAGFSEYPDDAYGDVVSDVMAEWSKARDEAVGRGMRPERVWLDPEIGFAKNARHSLELLTRLDGLVRPGARVVVGPSRKSFIAALDESAPDDRLGGTIAACLAAAQRGAHVLRVHDVKEVRQALTVADALGPKKTIPEREPARA